MSVGSRIAARLAGLPAARTRDVRADRDLPVPMPDGGVLLADRWYPAARPAGLPLVLVRTPYGRRQLGIAGRLLAERGYQVLIQSCRGTFGSDGEFEPFRNERADGLATLDWLAGQPWFGGVAGTYGGSYLGLTQWAVAGQAPDFVRAMALAATCSSFRDMIYPGGSFSLETALAWIHQIAHQESGPRQVLLSQLRSRRVLEPAFAVFPAEPGDQAVTGGPVGFYRDWLAHGEPGDPWWDPVDFSKSAASMPPVTLLAGWYDLFLPYQLADYQALRAAGRTVRLRIGPWTHTSPAGFGTGIRDALEWFDVHLRGEPERCSRAPVSMYILGARRWAELPGWPPPAIAESWRLQPAGRLAPADPPASEPDRYRYDPADPTPGAGGTSLNFRTNGPKGNRAREARADVLCYTSDPLTADLTVAGRVSARLYLRSTADRADFVVRLCDVRPSGRSVNISDGIIRLRPAELERDAEGAFAVRIPMWDTAVRFRRGHRLRLQVSSGAHPGFARNPGAGDPLSGAADPRAADHEVLHDLAHPSAIELPVADLTLRP